MRLPFRHSSSHVFLKWCPTRKPDYPIPSILLPKISYDILTLQKQDTRDLDTLVVGGGVSASEYVQILTQMKNKVTLSFEKANNKEAAKAGI